jgi:hypothetical protein
VQVSRYRCGGRAVGGAAADIWYGGRFGGCIHASAHFDDYYDVNTGRLDFGNIGIGINIGTNINIGINTKIDAPFIVITTPCFSLSLSRDSKSPHNDDSLPAEVAMKRDVLAGRIPHEDMLFRDGVGGSTEGDLAGVRCEVCWGRRMTIRRQGGLRWEWREGVRAWDDVFVIAAGVHGSCDAKWSQSKSGWGKASGDFHGGRLLSDRVATSITTVVRSNVAETRLNL